MAGPLPSVKEPHLAGRWYPVAPAELAQSVRELLAAGGSPRPGVVAVVVPHAAYQYSGPTAAHGFAAAGAGVRRAIVLAPSHFAHFRGAALLPMSGYRTPPASSPTSSAPGPPSAAGARSRSCCAPCRRARAGSGSRTPPRSTRPATTNTPSATRRWCSRSWDDGPPASAPRRDAAVRPLIDAAARIVARRAAR